MRPIVPRRYYVDGIAPWGPSWGGWFELGVVHGRGIGRMSLRKIARL